jgi:hypothetical protein
MFDPFSYMNDKDLLVIGNAVIDKEPDYSKYNCIVRMNLGIKTKPCDVWINNLVNKAHEFLGDVPEFKNIIRLNAEKDGKRMNRMPQEIKPHAWLWNSNEYNFMCRELGYYRPTTGLVAIYWILNNIKFKSMTVTGYDFFKTPNRYTMEVHATSKTYVYPSHDIRKDEYWIMKWAEQGKYAII